MIRRFFANAGKPHVVFSRSADRQSVSAECSRRLDARLIAGNLTSALGAAGADSADAQEHRLCAQRLYASELDRQHAFNLDVRAGAPWQCVEPLLPTPIKSRARLP